MMNFRHNFLGIQLNISLAADTGTNNPTNPLSALRLSGDRVEFDVTNFTGTIVILREGNDVVEGVSMDQVGKLNNDAESAIGGGAEGELDATDDRDLFEGDLPEYSEHLMPYPLPPELPQIDSTMLNPRHKSRKRKLNNGWQCPSGDLRSDAPNNHSTQRNKRSKKSHSRRAEIEKMGAGAWEVAAVVDMPIEKEKKGVKAESKEGGKRETPVGFYVKDDALTNNGSLSMRLNRSLLHMFDPVAKDAVRGRSCQLCRWATGRKSTAQLVNCEDCNVTLCTWCWRYFHTVEDLVGMKDELAVMCLARKPKRFRIGESTDSLDV